jgi:vacuolar-type H+-ATPase subunit H
MREIIQQLLEAEEAAARTVATARSEAERILADARREAATLLQRSEIDVEGEAKQLLETAILSAEKNRQNVISEAENRFPSEIHIHKEVEQSAVDAVVGLVIGLQTGD